MKVILVKTITKTKNPYKIIMLRVQIIIIVNQEIKSENITGKMGRINHNLKTTSNSTTNLNLIIATTKIQKKIKKER